MPFGRKEALVFEAVTWTGKGQPRTDRIVDVIRIEEFRGDVICRRERSGSKFENVIALLLVRVSALYF